MHMRYLTIILIIVIIYVYYEYTKVNSAILVSKGIVNKTIPFEKITDNTSLSLLVLGDSTAYGVGANSSADSVPALFANYINATHVENLSVSGAKVQDLKSQLQKAKLKKYDYILIQIGGNDIVARNDVGVITNELQDTYKILPESKQIIHICCGDVGTTTIMPWFVRGYYTKKTLAYHAAFEKLDTDDNVTYINLYDTKDKDPFVKSPELYLAADGFHPSTIGYEYWFSKIKEAINI